MFCTSKNVYRGGALLKNNNEVNDLIDDTNNGGNTPNTNNSSTNVGVNNNSSSVTTNKITPQTFSFKSDEIAIAKGSGEINFSYSPDDNTRATSTAYQYRFNNSMKVDMAVNLKSISTTSVTLSYAYSDTALDTISSTSNIFECQRISPNATKYIYIVVTPTSTSIPSTFSSSVVFYQGVAGTLDIMCEGETLSTQTIVKGQLVSQPVDPEVPDGYLLGDWYLDEACTIKATFPLRIQNYKFYVTILSKRDSILYGDNGTIDSEGYTLYGAYPQDYVGNTLNTTLKNALSAGTLNSTGYTYTTDINGTTTVLLEYEYNNCYYAYLPSATINVTSTSSKYSSITSGNSYFFKVSPLRWINQNGLYLCDNIIGSMAFSSTLAFLWENSEVRTYLNEVFYIESGINMVKKTKTTIQNNSLEDVTIYGSGNDTEDYIWFLAIDEYYDVIYSTNMDTFNVTQFAYATYCIYNDSGYNHSQYWLRSATGAWVDKEGSLAGAVYEMSANYRVDRTYTGMRPCFAL